MRNHLSRIVLGFIFVLTVLAFGVSKSASAQEFREPPGSPLPPYAKVLKGNVLGTPSGLAGRIAINGLPNIMLTGYWPPTNEMLRRFSPNPDQNPSGWIGENWEGRGYNIYSFFPEFPHGLGKGEGDFEVDYQDTSEDFWIIISQINPIAVITFGRAGYDTDWELEWRQRNLDCADWFDDYEDPFKPTPCPPDGSAPAGAIRYSSLPMDEIVEAVNAAQIGVNAFVDTTGFAGAFLCANSHNI